MSILNVMSVEGGHLNKAIPGKIVDKEKDKKESKKESKKEDSEKT